MFSVPESWRPMVPDETKEQKVFRTFISEWLQKNPHAAVAWLSIELPVLYRTYNLHTIFQLEEMNFATTK